MENMRYIVTLKDEYDIRRIRITSEQKKLLDWLDGNDYLESWADEYGGHIEIEKDNDYSIIDLTI